MNYKICIKCGEKLEATTEFFSRQKRGKYGLRTNCKKCQSESYKLWLSSHRQERKEYNELWHKNNKKHEIEYRKQYEKLDRVKQLRKAFWLSDKTKKKRNERRAKNPLFYNMSAGIRAGLNGGKNGLHWETLVDYTLPELKLHLENLFQQDMSWDNYGEWHIDHKKPKVLFNITDYNCDDFKECWALENLQPLWASENCSKGAKYKESLI